MDKVLRMLEQRVEWIALGLGGLWLLWIVWAYGLSSPVVRELPPSAGMSRTGQKVVITPSSVDSLIAEGPARLLAEKIQPSGSYDFPVPAVAAQFEKAMTSPAPRAFAYLPVDSAPLALGKIDRHERPPVPEQDVVSRLPAVAAPEITGALSGRSHVILPVPPGKPDAAGGAAVQPVAAKTADKFWVTVFARFPAKEQEALFQDGRVPQFLNKQTYLEVQLQRAEVLPGGKLGKYVTVAPLPMNVPPVDRKTETQEFLAWAENPANQARILQPDFYQIAAGDPWRFVSGEADTQQPAQPEVTVTTETFDVKQAYDKWKSLPTDKEKNDYRMTLTLEQRQALAKYIYEEQAREAAEKIKAREKEKVKTPTKKPSGRSGAGDVHDARVLQEMYAQAATPPRDDRRRPGYDTLPQRPGAERYPMRPSGPAPGQPAPPPPPPAFVRGSIGISPDADGNIVIWAHDDSADPGRIYVYRMRVVLKNPFYQTNVVKPELAKILEIPVDPEEGWSQPSKPITIAPAMRLELAGSILQRDREMVRFQVWKWQNGQLNKAPQPFTVGPGDMIGGPDKTTGVDFTTGWMVVDVRGFGTDNLRVTLVDEHGNTEVRRIKADSSALEPKAQGEGAARPGGMVAR